MTYRIAQISDTHLSRHKPFFVANFQAIGAGLRADPPDLVLNSGDISLDGENRPEDLAAAASLHDALGLPLRFIPGNHDLGDDAADTVSEERRERYRARFGADFWAFDVPGWRVIGLNALLLGSTLPAREEQEAFLGQALEEAGARAVPLFLHKPLFDADPAETAEGGRFVNPAPRRRLLSLLGARPPALVACGHVHQFRTTEADGVRHVWAPSTAFTIPDERQPRYGLKAVGHVLHALHADGTSSSHFVASPGTTEHSIADFPEAYDH
ncbi:metallophosphoesterase family protein [Zavarzinia sp. CC-PAN008]|uniref:metallophosphoesterase family protein n=1 Tax=Zavarzinia sp. CC-PAN008 TaxID=3243332 RepID=UPI003F74396A